MKSQLAKIAALVVFAVAITACGGREARVGTLPTGWDYEATPRHNFWSLIGEPIDPNLQWQVDDLDMMLFSSGYYLDERYWASYVGYASDSCRMVEDLIQMSIDENWKGLDASMAFQVFNESLAWEMRSVGQLSWVDEDEALSILAAGMTLGECQNLSDALHQLVHGR